MSKKKEIASKMGGRTKGEFYTQAGDRPHEGTNGMRAKQTGSGSPASKGMKSTLAFKGGSFKVSKK
jgi:hypothetical protein